MQYPQHIAIIPDGNRTRAREQGLPQIEGHLAGEQNSLRLVEYVFSQTPIKVATFWGLSYENMRERSTDELDYLFQIYKLALEDISEIFEQYQINFKWTGNPQGLPDHFMQALLEKQTKHQYTTDKTCVIAINYGGRDEIVRGIQAFFQSGGDLNNCTAEQLSKYMDFADLPIVDLVIRTKGNVAKRLSGFMSWWIGYAELYFTDTKFPGFTIDELEEALKRYDSIATERNFGK